MGIFSWLKRRKEKKAKEKVIGRRVPSGTRVLQPSGKSGTKVEVVTSKPSTSTSRSGGGASRSTSRSSSGGGTSSSQEASKMASDARAIEEAKIKKAADQKASDAKKIADAKALAAKQQASIKKTQELQKQIDARLEKQRQLEAQKELQRIKQAKKDIISAGGRTKTSHSKNRAGQEIVTTTTIVDKLEGGKRIKERVFTTKNLATGEITTKRYKYNPKTRRVERIGGIKEKIDVTNAKELKIRKKEFDRLDAGVKRGALTEADAKKIYDAFIVGRERKIAKQKKVPSVIDVGVQLPVKAIEKPKKKLNVVKEILSIIDKISDVKVKDIDLKDIKKKVDKIKIPGLTKDSPILQEIAKNAIKEAEKIGGKPEVSKTGIATIKVKDLVKPITGTLAITKEATDYIFSKSAEGWDDLLFSKRGFGLQRTPVLSVVPKAISGAGRVATYFIPVVGQGVLISDIGGSADTVMFPNSEVNNLTNKLYGEYTRNTKVTENQRLLNKDEFIKINNKQIMKSIRQAALFEIAITAAFIVGGKLVISGAKGLAGLSGKQLKAFAIYIKKQPRYKNATVKLGKINPKQFVYSASRNTVTSIKKFISKPFRSAKEFNPAFKKTIKQMEKKLGEKLTPKEIKAIKSKLRSDVQKQTLKDEILKGIKRELKKSKKTSRIKNILESIKKKVTKKPAKKFELTKAEKKRVAQRKKLRLKLKKKKAKKPAKKFELTKAEKKRVAQRKKLKLKLKKKAPKKEFKLSKEELKTLAKRKKEKAKELTARFKGKTIKIVSRTPEKITRDIRVSKKFIKNEKAIADIIKNNLKKVKIQPSVLMKKAMRNKIIKLVEKVRPIFIIGGRSIPSKKIFSKMKTSTQFNSFVENKVIPSLKSSSKKSSSRATIKATGTGSQQLVQIQKTVKATNKFTRQRLATKLKKSLRNTPTKLKPKVTIVSKNINKLATRPGVSLLALSKIGQSFSNINSEFSKGKVDLATESAISNALAELSKVSSIEKVTQATNTKIISRVAVIERQLERFRLKQRLEQRAKSKPKVKKKKLIILLKKKKYKTKTLANPVKVFDVHARIRGKDVLINKRLTERDAKNFLAKELDNTLARSAKLIPKGKSKVVTKLPKKYSGAFGKLKRKLRPFKTKKGKKKVITGYIEKKKFIGDTRQEIIQLQLARKSKKVKKKKSVSLTSKKGVRRKSKKKKKVLRKKKK